MTAMPTDTSRPRAVPLVALPPGSRARILTVTNGGHGVRMRLLQMGLTPGAVVEIVENYGRGPILVRVRGAVIALGRGLAEKVLVEPV
ncbi:putative FeoA domain - Fe2+ transport [Hyperthermus butylicus DSM 5456]|uniref:FeoA domain-Fe2+ transport n=2 Tax=Hyperthermus butylicus TaxID=54248 RepID=A2BJ75_HYPBU|nr:putative FeoA domain - Fe2+ transport [Hyperthermus butylicus DSM 5456]